MRNLRTCGNIKMGVLKEQFTQINISVHHNSQTPFIFYIILKGSWIQTAAANSSG